MTQRAEDTAYCADLVRRLDPDRWLTALFAPQASRAGLLALYAFNSEVARTAEQVREPLLGRIRLQWWRETIDGAYAGAPRQQPIARSLAVVITESALDRTQFDRLIDAREIDLDTDAIATLRDLSEYAEGTSSTLVALALQALGQATRPARPAGIAIAFSGLMRALPAHAAMGRVYVPRQMLGAHSLVADDLRRGNDTAALPGAIAEICTEARVQLAAIGRIARPGWPALAPARLAHLGLKRLAAAAHDPARTTISPLAKQAWLLGGALLNRI